MKTTKAHFKAFEAECQRLWKLWGMSGWTLLIKHEKTKTSTAEASTNSNYVQRIVWVTLNTDWSVPITTTELLETARHEMVHAMLQPLGNLATQRYIQDSDLDMAEHEVLHRLMKLLPS
jgi:hypothetical protein